MSSQKEASTDGGLARVQVRQVETNEEYSCELEVDPSVVVPDGQILQDVCFEFLHKAAETDNTLTEDQAIKLHFVPSLAEEEGEPQSVETQTPTSDEKPVHKIVNILRIYAEDTEKKVKEDKQIAQETRRVLEECIKRGDDQTDSGGGGDGRVTIDLKLVWSHIKEVFQLLLSDLTAGDVDEIRLLTRLGSGLGYCYYLIKQLVIMYLESLTFKGVFDIMCSVVSVFMQHLAQIKFGDLLTSVGGWGSLAATTVVDQGTRAVANQVTKWIPTEYIFWGAAVLFVAGAIYLRVTRK